MATLNELVEAPVEYRETEATVGGVRLKFRGSENASKIAEAILQTPDEQANEAKLWAMTMNVEIDPGVVKWIKLVHAAIVSEEWVPDKKQPEPTEKNPKPEEKGNWVPMEYPYDVTVIAGVSARHGMDFLTKAVTAACNALGLNKKDIEDGSTLNEILAPNSDENPA
jgi:hypothetical protein